jgi:hypothetical protein
MKYLVLFLFTLLGALMCWFSDYETVHGWSGGEISPHSWNLVGSALIGGGSALFTLVLLQEMKILHNTNRAVSRRF